MTDPEFEARVEAALHNRVRAVQPRSRLDEVLGAPLQPVANRPRRLRLLLAAAAAVIVVGSAGAVAYQVNSSPVGDTETIGDPAHQEGEPAQPAPEVDADIGVWLDPDATATQIETIKRAIETVPEVESFLFIDQEGTLVEFREVFADRPEMIEVVSAEQLPPSFRLTLTSETSRDRVAEIASVLEDLSGVRDVTVPFVFPHPDMHNSATETQVPPNLDEPPPTTTTRDGEALAALPPADIYITGQPGSGISDTAASDFAELIDQSSPEWAGEAPPQRSAASINHIARFIGPVTVGDALEWEAIDQTANPEARDNWHCQGLAHVAESSSGLRFGCSEEDGPDNDDHPPGDPSDPYGLGTLRPTEGRYTALATDLPLDVIAIDIQTDDGSIVRSDAIAGHAFIDYDSQHGAPNALILHDTNGDTESLPLSS